MKNPIAIAAGVLGLALSLLASSCANYVEPTGTHRMGPPGRDYVMPDAAMPSRARR